MRFEYPTPDQIPGLRGLWKQAFGDGDEFLDRFFATGFSPRRCRCATVEGALVAAVYWLDGQCGERRLAYLYAVATDRAYRGRGICRGLLADVHGLLAQRGYDGVMLVPGEPGLWDMYRAMGYREGPRIRTVTVGPGTPLTLEPVTPEVYARLRRQRLPEEGVIQEGAALRFLAAQCGFYTGEGVLLAARKEGDRIVGLELLGDPARAPGVVAALGGREGTFRCPGAGAPFAMFLPLRHMQMPGYFGFAFDM